MDNPSYFAVCPGCGQTVRIADVDTENGLSPRTDPLEWLCRCNFEDPILEQDTYNGDQDPSSGTD